MPVHEFHVHVCIFCAAGNEHRHPVNSVFPFKGSSLVRALTVGVVVTIVIFQHTQICQLVKKGVELLF